MWWHGIFLPWPEHCEPPSRVAQPSGRCRMPHHRALPEPSLTPTPTPTPPALPTPTPTVPPAPTTSPTPPPPADTALVGETSGSTAAPKRVMLSASALRSSCTGVVSELGGHGQWLLALPAHYIAG